MTHKFFGKSTKVPWLPIHFPPIRWVACLLFLISSARGGDSVDSPTPDPIDQKFKALVDGSDGSTSGIVHATNQGYELWDQELDRVYEELMRKLPREEQAFHLFLIR
jgi:hypothetical protein